MVQEEFPIDEINFISDQNIITTKNRLTKKLIHHLEHTRSFLVEDVHKNPFPGIHFPSGKISKGENYLGFPYLVLDYPAILKKEDIFALRTIIWWGNHVSNVFIIKGKYLRHFEKAFLHKTASLSDEKLFYKGESPWINEMNKKYVPCHQIKEQEIIKQIHSHGFVKIVEIYGLHELNNLSTKTEAFLNSVRGLLY